MVHELQHERGRAVNGETGSIPAAPLLLLGVVDDLLVDDAEDRQFL